MSYRFVKIKDKKIPQKGEYPYMLYCDSMEQLVEHDEKFMRSVFEDSIKDYLDTNLVRGQKHYTNNLSRTSHMLMEIGNISYPETLVKIENDIKNGKLKTILQFGNVLLRENGTYMVLTDDFEVIEEVTKDKLVYPTKTFTKDDISITKVFEGKHWYGRIGYHQVIDKEGNIKWNTYEYAMKMAIEYLNELTDN